MVGNDSVELADAPVTVSEVAHRIGRLLDGTPDLRGLRISGEVANLRLTPSGHHFFRLRDNEAALGCALFRFTPGAKHLEDGAQVICEGRANFYVNRGDLQIVVTNVEPAGLGALQARLDELRRRLTAEGLFEASRKRFPPRFPSRIAVITAEGGSVWQDILNVLRRRYPLAEVVLLPVTVQGAAAAGEIEDAFAALDSHHAVNPVDVAILARGGGSLEDLMPFNEESVVRAIFACRVPVVSGVGHETDTTLADLVADRRAPTPSAAAELISPDQLELRSGIASAGSVMRRNLDYRLGSARDRHEQTADRLQQASSSVWSLSRERLVRGTQQLAALRPDPAARLRDVGYARNRIASSLGRITEMRGEQLRGMTARLRALSHVETLRRGFAIVRGPSGRVIHLAAHAELGGTLQVQFSDGDVSAEVTDVKLNHGEGD